MAQISARDQLIKEIKLLMAAGIVTINLDNDHYNMAIDMALGRYRQRSNNALEESFLFLDIQPDVSVYTLPDEVQEIRMIYRRNMTGTTGGSAIDPFSLAFTNNIYMLQNPAQAGSTSSGTLATYDIAVQFQNLVGRMFGRDVMFNFDPATHRLVLHRRFMAVEQVCLHIFNVKPEFVILIDPYAKQWLRDYAVAVCKDILGQAWSKFSSIAGPQGGITLNGESMKQEAKAEKERLDLELTNFTEQGQGMPFMIG